MEETAMKIGKFRALAPAQEAERNSLEAQKRLEIMERLGAGWRSWGLVERLGAGGEAGASGMKKI